MIDPGIDEEKIIVIGEAYCRLSVPQSNFFVCNIFLTIAMQRERKTRPNVCGM